MTTNIRPAMTPDNTHVVPYHEYANLDPALWVGTYEAGIRYILTDGEGVYMQTPTIWFYLEDHELPSHKEDTVSYIHFITDQRRCMVFNVPDFTIPTGAEIVNSGDWVPALILDRLPADTQMIVSFYNWGQTKGFNPDANDDQVFWADASGITHIKVNSPVHKGWEAPFKALGAEVDNTAKLAKRLKELVRLAAKFTADELDILFIDAINADHEMMIDGQNGMSRRCARKLGLKDWEIRSNLRSMGPLGTIKGDVETISDAQMKAKYGKVYDLVVPRCNLKTELRTDGWSFTTVNPHHAHNQAMFDVQSVSWLGEWLYPRELMKATLTTVIDTVLESLNNGEWPSWMILPEDVAHIDSALPLGEQASEAFNRHYLRWQLFGRKPEESAAIMGMAANAFKSRLQSKLEFRDANGVWKPKMWIPLPWAFYAHILTHECLEMLGYEIPAGAQDKVFYHEPTRSLSIPGDQFIADFMAHGGPDGDDSIKVMIRQDLDGNVWAVLVRSPNSDGEYSIHEVYDWESMPLYHTYGDMPVIDINNAPARIEVIREGQTVAGMPERSRDLAPTFTKEEALHMVEIQADNPGVGRIANAMMVYYDALKSSPTHILAGMEDIVDCVQQTPYAEGFTAINEFNGQLWDEIKDYGMVDSYLARTRVPGSIREELAGTYDGYFSQLFTHFAKEVKRFSELSRTIAFRKRSENLIPEVMTMKVDFNLGIKWVEAAEKQFNAAARLPKGVKTQANHAIIRKMVAALNAMSDEQANFTVLCMYRYCVTPGSTGMTRYGRSDRCLFAPLPEGEQTVMDVLMRALSSF